MKLALIGIVSLSLIASAGVWPAGAGSVPPPQTAAKTKEARKLFKQKCAKCHGADGAGNTTYGQIVGATDLTDREWQQQVDDERILNSLTHGRGQMPAFDKKLTNEQLASLALYVRSFKK